jgi:xanthine dehydrogenase molybdopterin-binding subunit B
MRGAGKPQANALTETIIEHLAHELKMDSKKLRVRILKSEKTSPKISLFFKELNFYKVGDETPFHQIFKEEDLHPLYVNWERILKSSDFVNRKSQVAQFNQQNKWVKRGISLVPTRYPFHSLLINTMLKVILKRKFWIFGPLLEFHLRNPLSPLLDKRFCFSPSRRLLCALPRRN